METYRRKDDGALVRAHRKENGDWLLQTETGGSFMGVNDWYFIRTYEEVRTMPAELLHGDPICPDERVKAYDVVVSRLTSTPLAAVVQAARDMHEHMVSAHPQQACASCGLRIKGLSEALGALDTKTVEEMRAELKGWRDDHDRSPVEGEVSVPSEPVVHKYRPNTTGVLCGIPSCDSATTSGDRNDTTCPACLRLWYGSDSP